METFYNTTHESGQTLVSYTEKAKSQDQLITEIVQRLKPHKFNPEIVLKIMIENHEVNPKTPLTSIRRSFSSLRDNGVIVKTDQYMPGDYGRRIHQWEAL